MADYRIEIFSQNDANDRLWDDFVLNSSVNGTFLQTRNFLNYHPGERFKDASLWIYDRKKLAAVIPACVIASSDGCELFSHKGSTYGGFIINRRYYKARSLIEMLEFFEAYCQKHYKKVTLKLTPDIFCAESSDLLQYVLDYKGYDSYTELSSYIDFSRYKENILSNFSQGKRTNVNNCIKVGFECRRLISATDIREFYNILCISLAKYHVHPVHTVGELIDFVDNRLPDNVSFWGIYDGHKMIAGSMLFYFSREVAHTQYLAALPEYARWSPMTFLYYSMIKHVKDLGYKKLSFGVSTENHGSVVNIGLTTAKELYGSCHIVHRTYFKELSTE